MFVLSFILNTVWKQQKKRPQFYSPEFDFIITVVQFPVVSKTCQN